MSQRTRLTLLLAAGTIVLTHGRASAQLGPLVPGQDFAVPSYAAPHGPLFPGQVFGVGTAPRSVAVGDLNGDGKLDIATAIDFPDSVSVLLNRGGGTFGSATSYGVGIEPVSVAIGDLNGDGKPDLATANTQSDAVSVLLNHGDGTFGSASSYGVGNGPESVAIGDLDSDGKLDVATADFHSSAISVLLNQGDGTFGSAVSHPVGEEPLCVAIGDLNGDGKSDLAMAIDSNHPASTGTVAVLLNQGGGTFGSASYHGAGNYDARSLAIGDLNGDGRLDLATANGTSDPDYTGCVAVLLNKGGGTFGSASTYGVGTTPGGVAIGDLNGDGKRDLVTANGGPGTVSVLLNKSRGTFWSDVRYGVGTGPVSVAMGDLNGDGKPDLAAANGDDDTVSVLLNLGSGTFGSANFYGAGNAPETVVIGDLNGDGYPDLATADFQSSSVWVLLNQGGGTYGSAVSHSVGEGPLCVAIGDLNGDGKPDLAMAIGTGHHASTGTVAVLLNQGGGTFGSASYHGAGNYDAKSLAIGDLDGDGTSDLATANNSGNPYYNGTVAVLLNQGAGTFGGPSTYEVGNYGYSVAMENLAVAIGDLNGDGRPDLATVNNASSSYDFDTVSVLLNQGGGAFGGANTWGSGNDPQSIAIGDLNGDGKSDLAVANSGFSDTVSVLLNQGGGAFGSANSSYTVGNDPRSVAIGDLNGDGKPDLATANRISDNLSVLLHR